MAARVQRVQRVQRGRWRLTAQIRKKGRRFAAPPCCGIAIGHACGVRVDGPGGPKVLRVLRFDGPLARGLWRAAFGGSSPLVAAPPPSPRCEACHTILRSLPLPYESGSLVGLWVLGMVPQFHKRCRTRLSKKRNPPA